MTDRQLTTLGLIGCGYTLSRVAARFQPTQCVGIKKSSSHGQINCNVVCGVDVAKPNALSEALHPYGSLCCLVDSIPPDPADPTSYARSIMTFVRERPAITRIIYLSTTGVFGRQHGECVDESTPAEPLTPSAIARYRVESYYTDQVEELKKQGRIVELCILRIPAIYGPGRGIGTSLKAGRYTMIENGEQWSNRIHVEDLAEIITRVVHSTSTPPSLVAITDGHPTRSREVVSFYCQQFNLAPPTSITREQAQERGLWTQLSHQKVSSRILHTILPKEQFCYPSYQQGAQSEFQ